jgi:hypothetical protein
MSLHRAATRYRKGVAARNIEIDWQPTGALLASIEFVWLPKEIHLAWPLEPDGR